MYLSHKYNFEMYQAQDICCAWNALYKGNLLHHSSFVCTH